MYEEKVVKKCTERPITETRKRHDAHVTEVVDFGPCIGDECARWVKTHIPMGATSNIPKGSCGLGGSAFHNPAHKPEDPA